VFPNKANKALLINIEKESRERTERESGGREREEREQRESGGRERERV
jgi:hypothetical protein